MMLIKTILRTLGACALVLPHHAQATEPERPWTLMIYGAADNNADGPILDFLDSVRVALDDDPGMELLLFIDRSEGFSDDAALLGSNFTGARIFRLRKDSAELLDADEFFPGMSGTEEYEVDSADPRNIEAFVAFGKQAFPAKNYGLMIYSHADGCTMCPDEESGNDMFIPQLTDEVSRSASVDFLALELCNMAGVEIAYQWRPGNGGFSTQVLVAIPNAGPPLDWDRAFQRIRTPGHAARTQAPLFEPAKLTPAQFGTLVVDEGFQGRMAMAERHPEMAERIQHEAASCMDLTRVEELKQRIDAFAGALAKAGARETLAKLRGPVRAPLVMNYSGDAYHEYPYADLYDLAERVAGSAELPQSARQAARDVCQSMQGFVLASFGMSGLKGFQRGKNGVFICFPDLEGWRRLRWYTPFEPEGPGDPYGRWAFLGDGAVPDNGRVDNWFELLDSWYDDTSDDPGGLNGYLW